MLVGVAATFRLATTHPVHFYGSLTSREFMLTNHIIMPLLTRCNYDNKSMLPQLNYLIDNDTNVNIGTDIPDLPSSCAADDVTSLHSYCFQMKVREQDQLKDLIRHSLYDPISDYYSGTVTDSSSSTWLETSSIPASQQSSIAPYL